jgi:hypothetical protein
MMSSEFEPLLRQHRSSDGKQRQGWEATAARMGNKRKR